MKPLLRTTLWMLGVLLVSFVAWLLWWWFGGDHTVVRLANCFLYGGLIVLGIGFLSFVGAFMGTVGHQYQYASTVTPDDSQERGRRDWDYRRKGHAISLAVLVIGLVSMGVGGLIHWVAS